MEEQLTSLTPLQDSSLPAGLSVLDRAEELMNAGQFTAVIELLKEHLKTHPQDYEALFLVARAYSQMDDFAQSYQYSKVAADEGHLPAAQAFLALHYCEGCGIEKNGPEALRYVTMAKESGAPEAQDSVNLCLGMMYYTGLGVNKDIVLAYFHFQRVENIDLAKEYVKEIESLYPMNERGMIDLQQHKRSKWATAVLCLSIYVGYRLLSKSYQGMETEPGAFVGLIVGAFIIVTSVGVLFWQKWAFLAMLGTVVMSVPVSALLKAGQMELPMIGVLAASLFFLLSMATLMIRRQGYAHPWCSLTGADDNGCSPLRRWSDKLFCYGEGDDYCEDSVQTQSFYTYHYIALALLGVLGIWAGITLMLSDLGWYVEWNVFESPTLWGVLSFIGFFLQFVNWTHLSYDNVTKVTYADGSKKTYKSNDVIDTMEGGILMPILGHLIIIPALYGAILYYLLMIVSALLSSLVPYVAGVAAVAALYLFYRLGRKIAQRKHRLFILFSLGLIFASIYFACILSL